MKTKLLNAQKILMFTLATFAAVGVMAGQALAATPSPPPECDEKTKGAAFSCTDSYAERCKSTDDCNVMQDYINPFITLLSVVVGIAVTIGIIAGGIQYSASAGDPQKAAQAKNRIWQAVVALIAYLFLYALLNFLLPTDVFRK